MSTMLNKYFFVCLLITFIRNAVCEISLDYYFGFEETLRSAKYIESCNSAGSSETCQAQCGPNHACLLGKCFCVKMKPQAKKEDVASKVSRDDEACNDLLSELQGLKEVLQNLRNRDGKRSQSSHKKKRTRKFESEESGPEDIKLNEMALRPTLRHHIAHFCPNLDVARECIRKCLPLGKPAFCGKDHVCYCGHKYSENDKIDATEDTYTPFQDLYEKYFGPRNEPTTEAPHPTTITNRMTVKTLHKDVTDAIKDMEVDSNESNDNSNETKDHSNSVQESDENGNNSKDNKSQKDNESGKDSQESETTTLADSSNSAQENE